MDNYYYFTILIAILFFFRVRIVTVLIVGCSYFLINLPSTNFDYDNYKKTYDNAFFSDSFPWFKTSVAIDAEPLYLFYGSFINLVSNLEFSYFLAFNFILCMFILHHSLSRFNYVYDYFLVMLLPTIFPTIFYFSPRSSISFILICAGFFTLSFAYNNLIKKIKGSLLLFLGISFHSQFILISFLLLLLTIITSLKKIRVDYMKIIVSLMAISLFFILKFSDYFINIFEYIINYLPSVDLASSKLHYLEDARLGFRITSILSVIIYPIMSYYLLQKYLRNENIEDEEIEIKGEGIEIKDEEIEDEGIEIFKTNSDYKYLFLLVFAIALFGAVINLAFIDKPHLAGRLSRFSDYLGFCFIVPLYLNIRFNTETVKIIIILLMVIAPFLFQTIYHNVEWGF